MIRWIIAIALFLAIEIYAFQAFRTITKIRWILCSYAIISLLLMVFILYSFSQFDRSVGQNKRTLFTIALFLILYIPKILLTFIMFGEDVFRLAAGGINYFVNNDPDTAYIPSRRKFISQIGLALAAIPFSSLIYGIFEGKYNFKVLKQTVYFPDLPDAFDGFKITQISDVHSGSFDNKEKIEYAIDLINEQEADMILFTGDIVNTFAKEMHPWIDTFNKIKSYKYGKYSVLGNHDYGEYLEWPSQSAKDKNFQEIKDLYGKIGFDLMLNRHAFIEKDGQKIALVGVENWGEGFKKAGDLAVESLGIAHCYETFPADIGKVDPEVPQVRVDVTEDGYIIQDSGLGMDIKDVFENYLVAYVGRNGDKNKKGNRSLKNIRRFAMTGITRTSRVEAWINGQVLTSVLSQSNRMALGAESVLITPQTIAAVAV